MSQVTDISQTPDQSQGRHRGGVTQGCDFLHEGTPERKCPKTQFLVNLGTRGTNSVSLLRSVQCCGPNLWSGSDCWAPAEMFVFLAWSPKANRLQGRPDVMDNQWTLFQKVNWERREYNSYRRSRAGACCSIKNGGKGKEASWVSQLKRERCVDSSFTSEGRKLCLGVNTLPGFAPGPLTRVERTLAPLRSFLPPSGLGWGLESDKGSLLSSPPA